MISLNIAVPNEDLRVAVMSLGIADVQKELKFHPKTGRIIKFGPKLTTDDDLPPEIAWLGDLGVLDLSGSDIGEGRSSYLSIQSLSNLRETRFLY